MAILSGGKGPVFFVDLRNETEFGYSQVFARKLSIKTTIHHKNTMKEIAGGMLEPKLTDIYSQETDEKDPTIEYDSKQKMMS